MLTFSPKEASILTLLAEATTIDAAAKHHVLEGLAGPALRIGQYLIAPHEAHELTGEERETAEHLLRGLVPA